ncbi:hypothetical protein DIPPA_57980, partial [Diplonema papillatum]
MFAVLPPRNLPEPRRQYSPHLFPHPACSLLGPALALNVCFFCGSIALLLGSVRAGYRNWTRAQNRRTRRRNLSQSVSLCCVSGGVICMQMSTTLCSEQLVSAIRGGLQQLLL